MDLELIEKYKRLFGIKVATNKFPARELKRRWRILSKKYHPDHGGKQEHFVFVQEAYAYLKQHCSQKDKEVKETMFTTEIGEIKVPRGDGTFIYLWDVGEPNFKKRFEYERKHPDRFKGRNLNVRF